MTHRPRVFISYARVDEPFAARLAEALPPLGIEPWIDRAGIETGARWSSAIQRALDESEALILVLSPASMASPNVEDEWHYALDKGKPVLPVLLEPCDVHFQLGRIQYVDAHALGLDAALPLLAESVHRALAGEDAPEPSRAPGAPAQAQPRKPTTIAPDGSDGPPHNLPHERSSFVGREADLSAVAELLADSRIVTLSGPGGAGKTRLAMRAAFARLPEHAQGAWLVDLAPLAPGVEVVEAVADSLGLRAQPGRPMTATLHDHLTGRNLLLLLDNCEHVLESASRLADDLVARHPAVRILATSREPLAIAGEHVYPVPTLGVPPEDAATKAAALEGHEAVQLFVERAKAAYPTFALSDDNAVAVAEICRSLDGIPLALELAAARVRALPPEKLAERLDQRFRILTGGSRTALPRQRTLAATIDWSYDLLEAREQAVLQRLSVFVGGCTLEAAEAVCAGETVEDWEVLDALGRLVDQSLVLLRGTDEAPRYALLETVRAYARERLAASGKAAAMADAHLSHFARMTVEQAGQAMGASRDAWIAGWDREMPNVRVALDHGRLAGHVPEVARLINGLQIYWWTQAAFGHVMESIEWVIEHAEPALTPSEHQRTLHSAVGGALMLGRFDAAVDHARRRLAVIEAHLDVLDERAHPSGLLGLARALRGSGRLHEADEIAARVETWFRDTIRDGGDQPDDDAWLGLNVSIEIRASIAADRFDWSTSEQFRREALEIGRRNDSNDARAKSLSALGYAVLQLGRVNEARSLLAEARDLAEGAGYSHALAGIMYGLGSCDLADDRLDAAHRAFEHAREHFQETGHLEFESNAIDGLGAVAVAQGALETAARHFQDSLAIRRGTGTQHLVHALTHLAGIALGTDRSLDALRLLGAVFEHWPFLEPEAGLVPVGENMGYTAELERIRDTLGDAAVDAALAQGRAMSVDEAVALAMTVDGTGERGA